MHIFAYMHIMEADMKRFCSILIVSLVFLTLPGMIRGYYLSPQLFQKGRLLVKVFDFYADFQMSNSYMNITGLKEQYGISNRINIYAQQPFYVKKQMGTASNAGIGDMRQGVIFNLLNFRRKNNVDLIFSLKLPVGYVAKNDSGISIGSGTYDTYIELLGNYFYKMLELRYYTSFMEKFSKGGNSQESDNFLTVAAHFYGNRLVSMTTFDYDYRFGKNIENLTFSEEILYKFNKKIFAKAGVFLPVIDNNSLKTDYKVLTEFYCFLR